MTAPAKKSPRFIEDFPIQDLVPYEKNARTHSPDQVDQIAASISEFGFTNPVLIDEKNMIVAGHGRLEAAKKLGLKTVPAFVLQGLTETQIRAYVLADNRIALNAGWDENMLALELADLQDVDFDLELLGFSDSELDRLLPTAEPLNSMPVLAAGAKPEFQQITFTLHNEQAARLKAAMNLARSMGPFSSLNENSNGNAIARVCEVFLSQNSEAKNGKS